MQAKKKKSKQKKKKKNPASIRKLDGIWERGLTHFWLEHLCVVYLFPQSLLKLLEQDNVEDIHRPILLCFLELTAHLQQRMALYSDPTVGITDWLTLPGSFTSMCEFVLLLH